MGAPRTQSLNRLNPVNGHGSEVGKCRKPEGERMEEVTLILTALATGASAGVLDALTDDVKDKAKAAYAKLHDLVGQRFRGNPRAELVLSEHQTDPETYTAP